MEDFKDWLLKEMGTSTGSIAGFARPSLPISRRTWMPKFSDLEDEDCAPCKKQKEKKNEKF